MSNKIFLLFFLGILSVFCVDRLPNTRDIFEKLYAQAEKNNPPQFSARLESKLITAQLRRIPKDKINFGKKPWVRFVFKQGHGFKIVIEHVDNYYKNMLSLYEDILAQSGLFLVMGRKNTYSKFIGDYRLYWLKGKKNLPHTLKIVEKDALKGDYGVFYIASNWQVQESKYYEDNKKVAELYYYYSSLSNYIVISNLTLNISQNSGEKKIAFSFEDYDFSKSSIGGAFD